MVDAIVVGGGPAGSTCAWKLREAGLDVLVLDRAAFPRTKLCAGWVTPEALEDLELSPEEYPHSLMSFDRLHFHWKVLSAAPKSWQHSIRRFEFDDFLLDRAGVKVLQHKVTDIQRDGGDYVVDGQFRSKYIVGAGGTACPVYRTLFHDRAPRTSNLQTATLEHEFAYQWDCAECHLWFFDDGLPGYAWYVPKSNGYVNVGLGGMADLIKERGISLRRYWDGFVGKLADRGFVHFDGYQPKGHSYYLRGTIGTAQDRNAFLVGDSIGLATRDMCEGIGPAVRSGLLAAEAIVTGAEYDLSGIDRLTGTSFVSKLLERQFAGRFPS